MDTAAGTFRALDLLTRRAYEPLEVSVTLLTLVFVDGHGITSLRKALNGQQLLYKLLFYLNTLHPDCQTSFALGLTHFATLYHKLIRLCNHK